MSGGLCISSFFFHLSVNSPIVNPVDSSSFTNIYFFFLKLQAKNYLKKKEMKILYKSRILIIVYVHLLSLLTAHHLQL